MSHSFYRSSISRDKLRELSKKSDIKALIHLLGHLSLLFLSGLLCYWLIVSSYYIALPFALFLHGTIFSFLGWAGASHELFHNTVFKNKKINELLLTFFSLLLWNNKVIFSRSHKVHHRYTLSSAQDKEVNPNPKISKYVWFLSLTFNFQALYTQVKYHLFNSLNIIKGDWAIKLFPVDDLKARKTLVLWSRKVLVFHLLLMIIFFIFDLKELIIVVSLGSFFGNFFPFVLATAQHYQKEVDTQDFRLNSRTILLSPFFYFLYWGMNYHIEHHMYQQVPFYNLRKLRKELLTSLPPATLGLWPTIKLVLSSNKSSI